MTKKNKIVEIGKSVIKSEISALSKLKSSLGKSFEKAVHVIDKTSGSLVFVGVGKSKLILDKACGTFTSLGISAYSLDPLQASHGSMGGLKRNDTLIVASYSGSSSELYTILRFAKNFKIKVIGISSNSKSKLIINSDIKLILPKVKEAGNKNLDLVPTSSSSMLLGITDALAISIATKRNFKKEKFATHHPLGAIGKNLTPVKELLISGSKIPYVKPDSSIPQILLKISEKKLGCALVGNIKKVKGIITDGDISRTLRNQKSFLTKKAKDILTSKPLSIQTTLTVSDAIKLMNQKRITILLVYQGRQFKGLISMHYLLEFLN